LTISVLTALIFVSRFEGSEFSGGVTTAVILRLYDISTGLLVVGGVVCLFRRVLMGAAIVVAAGLLAAPLYIYVFLPGIFRSIVGGEYSVPLFSMGRWDAGAAFALGPLIVTTTIALAALLRLRRLSG
jgi:hypothetical protein